MCIVSLHWSHAFYSSSQIPLSKAVVLPAFKLVKRICFWSRCKYQIYLPEPKIRCPKYQILSAFQLVARKLFIVTLLLPLLVANSQIGEAGFTLLQLLLLLRKMTSKRCLTVSRDLTCSSSAKFLSSLLLHLSLLCPPLCGVEAGNSVVHRGDIQNHFFTRPPTATGFMAQRDVGVLRRQLSTSLQNKPALYQK